MVALANAGIFAPGPYSQKSPNAAIRLVGKSYGYSLATFRVKKLSGGRRMPDGYFERNLEPPFMPSSPQELFHPGGNSVCYAIQWGFIMGADPIFLLAFTLQKHGGYEFGPTNPVTRLGSGAKWRTELPVRPLHWLSWVEKTWPGRVRLLPGWSGPIYDVLETEKLSAAGNTVTPPAAESRPAWA